MHSTLDTHIYTYKTINDYYLWFSNRNIYLVSIYWLRFLYHTALIHICNKTNHENITKRNTIPSIGGNFGTLRMSRSENQLLEHDPLHKQPKKYLKLTHKKSRLSFLYTCIFSILISFLLIILVLLYVYVYIYINIYKLSLSFLYFMLLYISTIQRILPIETYRPIITKKKLITPQKMNIKKTHDAPVSSLCCLYVYDILKFYI